VQRRLWSPRTSRPVRRYQYVNDQEDVLLLFDDIARELVRIGHGVEGNEAFIEASHSRGMTTVALWGRRDLGAAPDPRVDRRIPAPLLAPILDGS
jgi:hypothetical protein